MIYLDASAWVKPYLTESGGDRVRAILDGSDVVISSVLGPIEATAAIARRHRDLSSAVIEAIDEALSRDIAEMEILDLDADVASSARALAKGYRLRAADAVHLASALLARAAGDQVMMVSSDRELLAAAGACGLAILDPVDAG